jgi:uncharacterized phage protein (TIGR01671 family)
MSREIKFRAWHKEDQEFLDGEYWRITYCGNIEDYTAEDEFSDNLILQQYTGINAKDGTEIYEGDILVHTIISGGQFVAIDQGVVKFQHGAYILDGSDYDKDSHYLADFLLADGTTELKIMGNIFEKKS